MQTPQRGFRPLTMLRRWTVIRKDPRAAEESGENRIHAGRVRRASRQLVRRNNAQQRPQFKNVPHAAPQNGHRAVIPLHGIAFPRDRLDQRGLATSIRAQYADVFTGCNLQGQTVQRHIVPAHDGDVSQVQQKKEAKTRSFRLPGWGGCYIQALLWRSILCPARQDCGLARGL